MRNDIYKLILLLLVSLPCRAQIASQDDFLGRSDVSCPAPLHRVAVTGSQSGTTQLVTITGATIVQDATYGQDYDVTIASLSMSFLIGINEPEKILGTGTPADWAFDGTTQLGGGSFITAVNTSTGQITMTADQSVTVASFSGFMEPARYYNPFSQTQHIGDIITSPQFTVSTPFGTAVPICDPEEHWVYPESVSQMCVQTAGGLCSYSQSLVTETATGGVVTANSSISLPTWIVGSSVTVFGVSDPTYDGSFSLASVSNSTGTITWNASTTNASAVGGTIKFGSNTYPLVSETQTGGVVTAIFTVWAHLGLGAPITTTGITGTGFNTNSQISSIFGQSFTYADASASGSGTGGTVELNGYTTWPSRFTNPCNAAVELSAQASQGLFFGAVGEDSTAEVQNGQSSGCPGNPAMLPVLNNETGTVVSPSIYAVVNLGGWGAQPIHDITNGLTHAFAAVFNNPISALDYADPGYFPFELKMFGVGGGATASSAGRAAYKSMFSIAAMSDDTDNVRLTSGGGLFRGVGNSQSGNGGGQFEHIGLMMAMTDPHMTISNASSDSGSGVKLPYIYQTDTVFGKTLSASAPATCSLTAPCSWPDYERNKYTTIGALNSAYGSNYTTFGSSETKTTGELVGTGDGTTTTFSHTLANVNATPGTFHFYLKCSTCTQVMVSGDCPSWPGINHASCPVVSGGGTFLPPPSFLGGVRVWQNWVFADSSGCIEVANGAGVLGASFTPPGSCTGTQQTTSGAVTFTAVGPNLAASSTVTYATGAMTINFAAAPPSGYQILVDYTSCGFATTCGTGLEDEDGTGVGGQWGTGTVNTSGTSVTLASGTNFSTGTAWNGLQIKIGASSFHIASVNSATSLTLTTSAGTLTGATFMVNGLGTNEICIINPSPWQASHAYTAYTLGGIIQDSNNSTWLMAIQGGTSGSTPPIAGTSMGTIQTDNTSNPPLEWLTLGGPVCSLSGGVDAAVIDAQQQLALDVTDWLGQQTAFYSSANHKMMHLLIPDIIDLGTNFSLQTEQVPMYPTPLQSVEMYSDAAFAGNFPAVSSDARGIGVAFDPISQYKYNFVTTYYNKPIMSENFMETSSGFDLQSPSSFQPNGLIARSNAYYDRIFMHLHTKSVNGVLQAGGETYWGDMPFQGHPFGYLDLSGLLPNGHDNVTGTVSCAPPLAAFSCGGELPGNPWNNVDAINCSQCLKSANQQWLALFSTSTPATSKRGMFADVRLIDPAWIAAQTKYEGRLF